ncbi:uncharacterized protein LOC126843700 [Adelges cooleyi]|uniref:uncharacterized protein LOC126843700 n=1 Tax=Adelges cooleyi TaxID=133065 RepID=UPI00217F6DCA|nr:uncharacterized protein LOC126843700 [Adelges cooleyi]
MLHSKWLSVILVLGLAVQICPNPYTARDVTDPKVFRCNCLVKAVTHMRLSRLSFDIKNTPADTILDIVVHGNAKEALSVLYNLEGVKIGSLWLLHLYTGLLRAYYFKDLYVEGDNDKPLMIRRKLFERHGYVTELLLSDWRANDCASYHLKDWCQHWIRHHRDAEILVIKEIVRRNNNEFVSLVETRIKLMNAYEKQRYGEVSDSLRMKNLLLNDLGEKTVTRKAFMNAYDVEVDWKGANHLLESSWDRALKVTWPFDHLQNLKYYYTAHFALLKIIFFRITSVHLLYTEVLEKISMKHSVQYAREWSKYLMNFAKMLRIEDDPDVRNLLTVFDKLGDLNRSTPLVGAMIQVLNKILYNCSLPLQCDATKPMVLNPTKVENDLRDLISSGGGEPEELITQRAANKFMTDVAVIFKGVDFGVVRSLIEYIDEIHEMTKIVLEEPALTFE